MPFGPASSWTYGNGVTDTRTFDQDYRITSITDKGTSNIQYNSYGYDADNNVTSITDNVTSANNQTLTYDQIDQLKSATGVYGTISSITYDSNSNRKTYGATTYTTPGLNDRMSVAGGSNITYISTGNVNAVGTSSMTYNQANQLKTATVSGTTSTYTYDFLGIRNKIKTGTTPFQITQYGQNAELLTETSAAATPVETDYAYFDGISIAAIQPGAATISALHTDNLGTVLRGTDSTKTVVYTANYNPNGGVTPTTTITMNLRYPGQHADSTGAYYNIFRYYDPSTLSIRYWQVDPIGLAGGFNPYVYGDNNPFNNIDLWAFNPQYSTEDQAGMASLQSSYAQSDRENVEYAGYITYTPTLFGLSGYYSYTDPQTEFRYDQSSPGDDCSNIVGYYHTHPYNPIYAYFYPPGEFPNPDQFSHVDKSFAYRKNIDGYVRSGHTGYVLKYHVNDQLYGPANRTTQIVGRIQ
jgi:RHS repeat-associated protein